MLNVMQVTFVTLRSARGDILSKGHQTFITLYSRYFKEMMQVCNKCSWEPPTPEPKNQHMHDITKYCTKLRL